MTGGYATLWSEQGQGTRTVAVFGRMHPDRQPLGDLEGCWVLLASGHPGIHWTLECISGKGNTGFQRKKSMPPSENGKSGDLN
ncbi:MAG: hypothetical protein R2751_01680 [Bacteroidales bacterium]